MNTREKGGRTFRKAVRYALTFPGTVVIPLYQVSRWAQPQPCDMILLRPTHWPRFVEVRTTTWGVSKPSTRQLAALPGDSYLKQIWRFRRGTTIPDIRLWNEKFWVVQQQPWEEG